MFIELLVCTLAAQYCRVELQGLYGKPLYGVLIAFLTRRGVEWTRRRVE